MAQIVSPADTAVREGRTIRSSLDPLGEPQSVGSLLEQNAARFARQAILCEKRAGRFEGVTWEAFLCDVVAFGRFLESVGVARGDRIAAVSRNRRELLVAEFSVMSLGAIHVPIFPGYSSEQIDSLIAHCGATAVVVSEQAQLKRMRVTDQLHAVVSFDPVDPTLAGRIQQAGPGVVTDFSQALSRGRVDGAQDPAVDRFFGIARAIDPGNTCLMMYTSGTVGRQKAVMLSHDNILSQQQALKRIWRITSRDRFLCYLPWHHSFGGIFEKYTGLYNGATLALDESYGKDLPLLIRNWKQIRPTVYFSVPMVYQELWNQARLHPEDEERIFHDELRFVFTAAAPLPAQISDYFAAKEIPVVEGWGLTETAPCCTVTDMNERRTVPGMVGYPIPGVELRLADDGEILVRGRNVTRGYYHDDEAFGRAFPGDGWFHTGDLGEFVGSGLKLLARKDRVFKLLNAEKVVPTVLENALAGRDRYIKHVLIVGGGQRFLAALIFPDLALIEQEFGEDREAAAREVKESFRRSILEVNRENPVKYEHLQAFAVVGKELTVEEQELTPSLKVRVQNVLENSAEYIEAIYDPSSDCDCRFLSQIVRLSADPRSCPQGKPLTLDRCHECGVFPFGERLSTPPPG